VKATTESRVKYALWVELPEEAPFVLRLDRRVATIGRSASNSIMVNEDLVSRFHAEISGRDDQYVVRDLDSKNGTFVNGEQVAEHRLANGDIVTIGNATLRFAAGTEESLQALERQAAAPSARPEARPHAVAPQPTLAATPAPPEPSGLQDDQVAALAALARRLHGLTDELGVLNEVVEMLGRIVPCHQARILLVEEESMNPLFYASPVGAEEEEPSEHIIQMGLLADETMCMGASPNHNPLLLVPLFDRGKRRGFIVFERRPGEPEYGVAEHDLASVSAALITGFLRYAI